MAAVATQDGGLDGEKGHLKIRRRCRTKADAIQDFLGHLHKHITRVPKVKISIPTKVPTRYVNNSIKQWMGNALAIP